MADRHLLGEIRDTTRRGLIGRPNSVGVFFSEYLRSESGSTAQAIADYSTVTECWTLRATDPNTTTYVQRLIVYLEDAAPGFVNENYGGLNALSNGIRIQKSGDPAIELTDGVNIMTNGEWRRLCYDMLLSDFGSGDDTLSARWTFTKPIQMKAGDRFNIFLSDNFTGLVEHTFKLQGFRE